MGQRISASRVPRPVRPPSLPRATRGHHRVLALVLSISAGAVAAAEVRAFRASGWLAPSGEIESGALIVVRDGRIVQIGGEPPADAAVTDFGVAVLSPGLVDCHAAVGAFGQLSEESHAINAAVSAADAIDRTSPQFYAAACAGVTTIAVCPDDSNLIGGRIAICRAAGRGAPAEVLNPAGPLKLSISPAVLQTDREPSSRSGALAMLRAGLAARDAAAAGDPLGDLAAGRIAAFFAAPSGADALAVAALAREHKLRVTILHYEAARDVAAELARDGIGVICGPLDFSMPPRATSAAGVFEAAGVKVAIAGGLPAAARDTLRSGAAIAARDGLSPAAARRAITIAPAEFLGVAERVGSLAVERDADLVVFSGDPLDLRSRVLAAYVRGVCVFRESELPVSQK